jgi:hypothetical protein
MDTYLSEQIILPLFDEHFFNAPTMAWAENAATELHTSTAHVLVEKFIIDCEERMMDVSLPDRDVYEGLRAEVMVNLDEYVAAVTSRLQSRAIIDERRG